MNKYLAIVNNNFKISDLIDPYENSCIMNLIIFNVCCIGCYCSIY